MTKENRLKKKLVSLEKENLELKKKVMQLQRKIFVEDTWSKLFIKLYKERL